MKESALLDFYNQFDLRSTTLDARHILEESLQFINTSTNATSGCLLQQVDALTYEVIAGSPFNPFGATSLPASLIAKFWTMDVFRFWDYEKGEFPCKGLTHQPQARIAGTMGLQIGRTRYLITLLWDEYPNEKGVINWVNMAGRRLSEILTLVQLRAEQASTRVRFEAILASMPHGIVFVEEANSRAFINKQVADYLEIEQGECSSALVSVALRKFRDRAANRVEIEKHAEKLFKNKNFEVENWDWIIKEPEFRVITISSRPANFHHVKGRIWVLQDTTGKFLDKQKLQELNQALFRKSKEAQEAVRAKTDFLSMISHEIRTPMNAVMGMTNLLMNEKPSATQREYIETIRFASDNLLVIINDLLDLNKIEAGKIHLESFDFNLSALLKTIKKTFAHKAEEKGIELRLMKDADTPDMVKGDKTRVNQILVNLIGNALKFTDYGTIEVVVNLSSEDEKYLWLYIEVRDTGIGIPEEKQEAIFHSFTQASMDTTRKYGGTGLGLTITKKLVEMQGGSLGVKSNLGEGSTFYFDIKLEKSGADVTEELLEESGGKLAPLGGARILLVEDNKVNQLVASKFLQQWDLKVIIANNGQEAVDLIQRRKFDLVLMDLQMPEMDGFEATRQIRHRTDGKNKLPIIALTASAAEEVRTKVIDWGMDDFVSKPFNPSELHLKIFKYLQKGSQVESYLAPPKIFKADKKLKILKNEQPLMSFAYVEEIVEGNDAFYMELLILYKKQIGEISELLYENMKTRDKEKMRADAHRYRTTLVTLNAFRLKEIMEDVKDSIRKSQELKKARLLVKEGQEICAKMDELLEEQFLKIRRNAS